MNGDARPQGIDTSHYNGRISIATLEGCAFAFGQASVGLWADPLFLPDQAVMKEAHLTLRGAYHYAVYGPGDTRQAEYFLAHASDADVLAVDAEIRGSNRILSHPYVIAGIIANIRKLDPHHRLIGLYGSRATQVLGSNGNRSMWLPSLGQDFNWVADYDGDPYRPGASPRVPWRFWQRSGTGTDHDVFSSTLADLAAMRPR